MLARDDKICCFSAFIRPLQQSTCHPASSEIRVTGIGAKNGQQQDRQQSSESDTLNYYFQEAYEEASGQVIDLLEISEIPESPNFNCTGKAFSKAGVERVWVIITTFF